MSVSLEIWRKAQRLADELSKLLGKAVAAWSYYDAAQQPVMTVVRFAGVEGKLYRVMKLVSGEWQPGIPEGMLPLYDLPEVIAAERIFICEGEKAAQAGRDVGLVCTTSALGPAAPGQTDWSPLSGKEVIILPDEDEPGLKYAQAVAGILLSLPNPAKVKIVRLPGLKPAEDLVEWIGPMMDRPHCELKRKALLGYAQQAEELTLATATLSGGAK